MTEKILSTKKNGMLVMILTIFLYALAIGGCIGCGIALAKVPFRSFQLWVW